MTRSVLIVFSSALTLACGLLIGQSIGREFIRLERDFSVFDGRGKLFGFCMVDTDEIECSFRVRRDLREFCRNIEGNGNRVAVQMVDFHRFGVSDFFGHRYIQ